MQINIYYGGRGLIDDPVLYVLGKIEKVFDELHVKVERYDLYESKKEISVLPKTLKDADAVILAVSVEWLGIGWLMQQFLDSCWLYGDKEAISSLQMMPIVISSTYGERQAQNSLVHSWEMLGGIPTESICAYVENHVDFETNADYNYMIEKFAENFYRSVARKTKAFPTSCQKVKQNVLKSRSLSLTPQESEQLSAYASDDHYVKRQKEDIEELANMFKGMLGGEEISEKYISDLKKHFKPLDDLKAVFQIEVVDENLNLVIDIDKKELNCYYGTVKDADVVAKTKAEIMERVIAGEQTFQGAFMNGDLNVQGNFKILRNFDTIFRFGGNHA